MRMKRIFIFSWKKSFEIPSSKLLHKILIESEIKLIEKYDRIELNSDFPVYITSLENV